jgi:simple sugar transport system permease protein
MYTVAVGGNKLAAAEAGINVRLTVIRNFVMCSVFAGLVGVFEAVRASSVTPDTAGASETMFRAVSAAVIGGTLLAGGEGTAVGALFGALFLGATASRSRASTRTTSTSSSVSRSSSRWSSTSTSDA